MSNKSVVTDYIVDSMDDVMQEYLNSDEHVADVYAITRKENDLYNKLPEGLKNEFLEYANLVSDASGRKNRATFILAFSEGVRFPRGSLPAQWKNMTEPQS